MSGCFFIPSLYKHQSMLLRKKIRIILLNSEVSAAACGENSLKPFQRYIKINLRIMSRSKWANSSNFMACLLQYLIRREHSCFKAKCLPELFVINLGIAGCHNQNRLISFPSEGQGLGDSSRAHAGRLSCLFNCRARRFELRHIIFSIPLCKVGSHTLQRHAAFPLSSRLLKKITA